MKITKRILIGNESNPLKKAVPNSTHQWRLFVRPFDENDLSLYNVIESVTFHLHESFQNPHRMINQPPYEITEYGWGEFEAAISITFKYELKSLQYKHTIVLFNSDKKQKNAITHTMFDEIIFINPNEEAIRALNTPVGYLPFDWRSKINEKDCLNEEKELMKKLLMNLKNALKKSEEEYHKALVDVPHFQYDQN